MRHAWHIFISILLWCLLGYYWYVVAQRQITADSGVALLVLAGIVLAGLVITLLWVSHNLRLSARLGRRQGFAAPPEPFTHDHLGRSLMAPSRAELQAATTVIIEGDAAGHKVYRIVDGEES
ncbi:MAG: hypothetical protein GY838_08025 [bacterium]|nr:hypothetical protein [bacterium]